MKKYQFVIAIAFLSLISCEDNTTDPAALTGQSVTYPLYTGAEEWGYEGEVVFAERKDGFSLITITLDGPEGTSKFPAHLHEGSYALEADMAAMLTPVDGQTGKSETLLKQLADGSTITYADLIEFDGHIKIHLGDGADKDVILAYGNIGSNPPTVSMAKLARCESW